MARGRRVTVELRRRLTRWGAPRALQSGPASTAPERPAWPWRCGRSAVALDRDPVRGEGGECLQAVALPVELRILHEDDPVLGLVGLRADAQDPGHHHLEAGRVHEGELAEVDHPLADRALDGLLVQGAHEQIEVRL